MKKNIVLGLFAALSACSGGATSTDTQADPSGGFRATLPPSIADADKLALSDGKIDYTLALRSAALKLTGNYPTLAEIKQLQNAADQTTVYSQLIDGYINRPSFNQQILQFWRDTFKMGGTLPVVTPTGTVNVNLEFAPTYAAFLIAKGDNFSKLVTGDTGTCQTYSPATDTFTATPCANSPAVGILTDQGVHAQFYSAMAFRRVRWFQEALLCSRFPSETNGPKVQYTGGVYNSPWDIKTITGALNDPKALVDFQDTSSLICANCHSTINHQAPLFGNFGATGMYAATLQVLTPVAGNPVSKLSDWLPAGEVLSYRFGQPTPTIKDFGAAMAADPAFKACMATRIWNWAMSRGDVVVDQALLTPDFAAQLTQQIDSNNWNLKEFIRATYKSAYFIRY
jgi:hypothetical protein